MEQWRVAFWINFAVLTISSTIYAVFASGHEQPWNYPDKMNKIEDGMPDNKNDNTTEVVVQTETKTKNDS